MNRKDEMAERLIAAGIAFTEIETGYPGAWPPAARFWSENNLQRCKNLFFRDNHGKNHFFAVLDFDRELDIERLKKLTGHNTLSFASPQRLKKYLDQEPGSVSVLGLVHDKPARIRVYIDENLENDRLLAFLPGEKTHFFALSFSELKKFLDVTRHPYTVARLY